MKKNSNSAVFVKLSHKKSAVAKKVILPSTLAALKKSISKVFNLDEPVGGLLNQQNEYIDDIRDINNGSMITAVLKSRMNNDTSRSVSVASSISNIQSESISESNTESETKQAPKLVISKTQRVQPVVKINNTKNNPSSQTPIIKIKNSKPETPNQAQNTKETPKGKGVKMTPKSSQKKTPNSSNIKKTQNKNHSYSEDDYEGDDSNDDDESSSYGDVNEPKTDAEALFQLLIPDYQDFSGVINDAFAEISDKTSDFLSQTLDLENKQKARYYRKILEVAEQFQMIELYNSKWNHLDKMRDKARSLIAESRIPLTNGFDYVLRLGIVGPKKAGKSTFLHICLRELLVDLVATDNWKTTFVFPYDVSQFIDGMLDLGEMYKQYINYIFAQLGAQCPNSIQLLQSIEKSFLTVTENRGHVMLPRKLTQNINLKTLSSRINEIVQELAELWVSEEDYVKWLVNLAMLPYSLSKAFGFTKIINIFDHFDVASTNIDPGHPFVGSETTVFPSEVLKAALSMGPFILSSKDSVHFTESLDSISENSLTNIRNYVKIFYLWNLIDKPLYNDKEISVELEKNKTQLRITSYACGGIPNYLIMWNEMNRGFDHLEQLDENTSEFEDAYCELVTLIERIANNLFIPEQTNRYEQTEMFTISNAYRRTITQK